jgi:two-component system sensor histidine kinase KdpD
MQATSTAPSTVIWRLLRRNVSTLGARAQSPRMRRAGGRKESAKTGTCDHGGVTVRRRTVLAYAVALSGPALLASALRPLARGDQDPNAAFAFLLVVLAAAALGGLAPGAVASLAAFVAFDLVFVEPYGTLTVAARRDVGVLAGFLVSTLVVSVYVASLARHRAQAQRQADDARLLYRLAVTAPGGDADEDVAAMASFVAAELSVAAVVVGVGGTVLYDAGLPAADAAKALAEPDATARLSDGEVVAVAVPGVRVDGGLLDALAARIASTVDRDRLRTERHDRLLLEQAEEQRNALLSAVSHDLRTPLAAIKASASALHEPDVSEADREALRTSIGDEADRLDRMVRNLLALGRIEGGRLVARPEPVPVDELVGSVLSRLRQPLSSRRLELDVAAELPPVLVDPVQGEQALGNLVENVIAHTPLNAGLIVRAAARGGWVTIRVADEGPGIPEQVRARVFERFVGSGNGRGAGLGLAIARAYAEANGGGLDVARAECGAAFDLWFPVAS